jgi:hypothetical protein
MKSKHREFMDMQQSNQSVYAYIKMFNHLTQYAPEQIDTNDKKKYRFMNGLSTKLQERLALIADDANHAHQESKKKKALTALAGSAPHKYSMVRAPHHHPPHQHHHQLATCPLLPQNIVPRAGPPHEPCCTHHHRRWA